RDFHVTGVQTCALPILIELDELALATAQAELRRDFPQIECMPVLGDCGDPAVVRHALALSQPEAVFHAAAYKQVPVLEAQLREEIGRASWRERGEARGG